MSKRSRDMEKQYSIKKRCRPRIKLADAPPINSIRDLIEIGQSIKFYKNIDAIMLWRITPYLEELNNLVGMTALKESLFYQILYYIQGMHIRNQSGEYLHTIIMGSPGTGKTTVAHIIAKIYQAMGILSPSGPFKVAHRDDFIAGYLGQTALKTQKLLKSCLGGVLFIDEVYAMASRDKDRDSFSKEAIDTLCSFLSEHTNDFCCIAAGYEKDINDCFFNMNQGLKRRFPWIHKIDDYTSLDLAIIFQKMVKQINWELAIDKKTISNIMDKNKEYFLYGGGDVENFLTKCKMVHSRRVISLDKEHKFVLTREDLNNGIKMLSVHKNVEKDEPPFGMYI
jgi:SpoVK/Ycf46/Vps4 family AAA+-type ATPase